MTSRLADLIARGFAPFAFGAADNLARLDPTPLGAPLLLLAAEDPDHADLHRTLNRLNGLAYGGADLAMPLWVQLDCGLLPSAFVGFAQRRSALPEALRHDLDPRGGPDAWVPVSEAIAVPSLVPGRFVSFSLASLVPGLGFATKLLALAATRCREAVGVAQYDNPALRLHARFGRLELLQARALGHRHPDRTCVYRLRVDPDRLTRLDRGERAPDVVPDRWLDPADPEALAALDVAVRSGERWDVVAPGSVDRPEGLRVALARGSA